jgi:hypothetical protein
VLAALGEAVWLIVRLVECAIDGTVVCELDDGSVCALDDAHFLVLFQLLAVDFVDMLRTGQVSAVAGDMI